MKTPGVCHQKYWVPRARSLRHPRSRGLGVTLLLTLITLTLLTLALSRQLTHSSVVQMTSLSQSFTTQSFWVAEGVLQQWAAQSQNPQTSVEDLLKSGQWTLGEMTVHIWPSSAQNKINVTQVPTTRWLSYWHKQITSTVLVDNPDNVLLEQGGGALESLLGSLHISAQDAYRSSPDHVALGDVLTVWGSGKVDLNRCSRDLLAVVLTGWTDAQVDGLVAYRQQTPIDHLELLAERLSLTGSQLQILQQVGTTRPETLELLIEVRKGGLTSLYHGVLQVGSGGSQILELRAVI